MFWIGVLTACCFVCFAFIPIITLTQSMYAQSPGEASVLVSVSGMVSGINYNQGFQFKAPWTHRDIKKGKK